MLHRLFYSTVLKIGTKSGLDYDLIETLLGHYWDFIGTKIGTHLGLYKESIGDHIGT